MSNALYIALLLILLIIVLIFSLKLLRRRSEEFKLNSWQPSKNVEPRGDDNDDLMCIMTSNGETIAIKGDLVVKMRSKNQGNHTPIDE